MKQREPFVNRPLLREEKVQPGKEVGTGEGEKDRQSSWTAPSSLLGLENRIFIGKQGSISLIRDEEACKCAVDWVAFKGNGN